MLCDLTSHILCWGNEKQMVNMLPNTAQDLGEAGDNLIPVEGPTGPFDHDPLPSMTFTQSQGQGV